jgi:hypothetical protein
VRKELDDQKTSATIVSQETKSKDLQIIGFDSDTQQFSIAMSFLFGKRKTPAGSSPYLSFFFVCLCWFVKSMICGDNSCICQILMLQEVYGCFLILGAIESWFLDRFDSCDTMQVLTRNRTEILQSGLGFSIVDLFSRGN